MASWGIVWGNGHSFFRKFLTRNEPKTCCFFKDTFLYLWYSNFPFNFNYSLPTFYPLYWKPSSCHQILCCLRWRGPARKSQTPPRESWYLTPDSPELYRLPLDIAEEVDSEVFGRGRKPGGRVELQLGPIAVVLNVLRAIQWVRNKFLQHVRWEFSVADIETEIGFSSGSNIHLAGQVVFDNRLGGVLQTLEITFDVSRGENSIAVNVDEVDVRFGEAEKGQLLAGFSVLGEVTVFANVPGVLAVAGDAIVLDKTLAAVLAGVGPLTGIDIVAIIQSNLIKRQKNL